MLSYERMMIMGKLLERMSFWSGAEAIAIVVISLIIYEKYVSKISHEDGKSGGNVDYGWLLGFMAMEIFLQSALEPNLDMEEAVTSLIADIIANIIIFFMCYGGLSIFGINKENKAERVTKAFKGVIIVTGLICFAVLK